MNSASLFRSLLNESCDNERPDDNLVKFMNALENEKEEPTSMLSDTRKHNIWKTYQEKNKWLVTYNIINKERNLHLKEPNSFLIYEFGNKPNNQNLTKFTYDEKKIIATKMRITENSKTVFKKFDGCNSIWITDIGINNDLSRTASQKLYTISTAAMWSRNVYTFIDIYEISYIPDNDDEMIMEMRLKYLHRWDFAFSDTPPTSKTTSGVLERIIAQNNYDKCMTNVSILSMTIDDKTQDTWIWVEESVLYSDTAQVPGFLTVTQLVLYALNTEFKVVKRTPIMTYRQLAGITSTRKFNELVVLYNVLYNCEHSYDNTKEFLQLVQTMSPDNQNFKLIWQAIRRQSPKIKEQKIPKPDTTESEESKNEIVLKNHDSITNKIRFTDYERDSEDNYDISGNKTDLWRLMNGYYLSPSNYAFDVRYTPHYFKNTSPLAHVAFKNTERLFFSPKYVNGVPWTEPLLHEMPFSWNVDDSEQIYL